MVGVKITLWGCFLLTRPEKLVTLKGQFKQSQKYRTMLEENPSPVCRRLKKGAEFNLSLRKS